MYISPFVCGVVLGAFATLALIVILSFIFGNHDDK